MLSEPEVLVEAKKFTQSTTSSSSPDSISYATVDTQFRRDEWIDGVPISDETRKGLKPFNHIKLGTGYPDMVVAGPPPSFLQELSTVEFAEPVIGVEAKGETSDESRKKTKAVKALTQAHGYLSECNAALAVIPSSALEPQVRHLARELDVGLLTVTDSREVVVEESPVPKGISTDDTASAVRWQAGAQRVEGRSFQYNHPKTYLAFPLAVYANGVTKDWYTDTISQSAWEQNAGESGAKFLGLIQTAADGTYKLTALGEEVVRFAIRKHGSVEGALAEMSTWGGRGSRTRLIERDRHWGELTRNILFQYPTTPFVVETIEEGTSFHLGADNEKAGLSLPKLVHAMYQKRPAYTVELFIESDAEKRDKVFLSDDSLDQEYLETVDPYRSTTVYQYKMMLRHCGILHPDASGSSTDTLVPEEDFWTLQTPLKKENR